MAKIFQSIRVSPVITGGTIVEWSLHPLYRAETPLTFQLQYSGTGSSDWRVVTTISNAALNGTFFATDNTQRRWSTADRGYYRVRMQTNDGQVVLSDRLLPLGALSREDRQMARYILDGEALRMRKGGVCGLLFKRKYWGVRCPDKCTDPNTEEIIHPHCPNCLGTGWVGGYGSPIPYWVSFENNQPVEIRNEEQGTTMMTTVVVRAAMCPEPRTNDIFLDVKSDDRWVVRSTDVVSQLRHWPLVGNVTMRLDEPTSVRSLLNEDHVG